MKRAMVVVILAGTAAGVLASHGAPAGVAKPGPAAIDHGVVSAPSSKPAALQHKSSLRITPKAVAPAMVAVVGLRAKA